MSHMFHSTKRLMAFGALILVVCAAIGGLAAPNANASVIYGATGVAAPPVGVGLVDADTRAIGQVHEIYSWDGLTGKTLIGTDRFIDIDFGIVYAGRLNPASSMKAQFTLQYYTSANGWTNSVWMSQNGKWVKTNCTSGVLSGHVGDDGTHHLAYLFGSGHGTCDGLYPGSYRVYGTYWFYNASGTLIGKMGEALESGDYGWIGDGAPDPQIGNTGPGVIGYIYLP